MRYYSSTAGQMTLSGGIGAADTTIQVNTTVGLPTSYPYTLVIDPGLSTEEIVDVSAASSTTLTVTRGVDSTAGQAHSFGAVVRHMMTARDLRESRQHEAATAAHGTAGAVVGTSDIQTLSNKTISGASNTLSDIPSSAVTGLDTHTSSTAAHGASGAVVGTTNTQALTNKDLTAPSNTYPTSLVTLTGVQTLTNKTVSGGTVDATTLKRGGVDVVTEDDTGWVNLALGTGWTAGVGQTPQYRRYRGVVYTRGGCVRGAGAGAVLAIFPVGSRPSANQFFGAHVTSDGAAYELLVNPSSGEVSTIAGYATGSGAVGALYPVAGPPFPV